jgi:Mg2+ and Co2+ transporter CorA
MSAGPRGREIYISAKTKKRLFWILQLDKESVRDVTVDSIADGLLNEIIDQKYPNMKVLEKRLDALEDQLVSELLTPTEEK